MQPDNRSLRSRSLQALKWSASGEFLARVPAPLTLLLLTRLVSPNEYGLFAGAVIVVTFCQVFVESGFTRALVQKKGTVTQAAPTVFWLVLAAAVVLYASVWLLSGPIAASVLRDSRAETLLRALALQIPIGALGATHRALLERELNFKPLFLGHFTSTLAVAVVSLSLAWNGWGARGLVIGALAGTVCEVAVLWHRSAFRPHLVFTAAELLPLARFSKWTLGQDVLSWLVVYADSLIVAAFMSLDELGAYRLGTLLVTGLFAVAFVPAEKVLFSAFSKFPDHASVQAGLCHLLALGSLIALPTGILLWAGHREIELMLFPVAWAGMGLVIGLVGLREGIANSVFPVDPAFKGIGRPDINFKMRAANLALLLAFQVAALPLGLEAFLVARIAATAIAAVIIVVVAQRFFGRCGALLKNEYARAYAGLGVLGLGCAASSLLPALSPWGMALLFLLAGSYVVLSLRVIRPKMRAGPST